MDQVFVGIDIAKESFVACALNEKQEKLFELTLPMDREGFQKLEKHLRDFPKESLLIGEESSGCYHINLFSFLVSQGIQGCGPQSSACLPFPQALLEEDQD